MFALLFPLPAGRQSQLRNVQTARNPRGAESLDEMNL
jgi:hypothetical protein